MAGAIPAHTPRDIRAAGLPRLCGELLHLTVVSTKKEGVPQPCYDHVSTQQSDTLITGVAQVMIPGGHVSDPQCDVAHALHFSVGPDVSNKAAHLGKNLFLFPWYP